MKKKIILFISGLLCLLFVIWDRIGNYSLCDYLSTNGHEGNCPFVMIGIETALLPIAPFFFFALITYFMREEVYRTWIRFAIPMLGISMLLTALMPDSQGGGFGPQISFGKPDVALLSSAIFVFISIILIARKYLSLRK